MGVTVRPNRVTCYVRGAPDGGGVFNLAVKTDRCRLMSLKISCVMLILAKSSFGGAVLKIGNVLRT
jgi:hypothetical protein